MEVTELSERDLDDLSALYREFWKEDSSIDKMRASFEKINDDPNYAYLVVKDNGTLAGTVMGVICDNLYGNCDPFMVIEDVVVSSEFRRRGGGTLLMCELERIAIERGCSQIIFVTETRRKDAISFYVSIGYDSSRYTGFKKKLKGG